MNHLFLVPNHQEQTMTSREMADLVEKRHDNVKRTIETLAARSVIGKPQTEVGPKASNNVAESVYRIGKRDSYIIVAQLSPEFTARLVDRWQELETTAQAPRALSTMEILELAMTSERERIRLEGELAIAAPKAEFADKYASATSGSKKFREVCKTLKVNEREFWEFLELEDIMYRLRKRQMPYQNHIDAGRFEVKTGVTDEGHAFNTVLFTPKGILWVAGEWAKFNLRGAA